MDERDLLVYFFYFFGRIKILEFHVCLLFRRPARRVDSVCIHTQIVIKCEFHAQCRCDGNVLISGCSSLEFYLSSNIKWEFVYLLMFFFFMQLNKLFAAQTYGNQILPPVRLWILCMGRLRIRATLNRQSSLVRTNESSAPLKWEIYSIKFIKKITRNILSSVGRLASLLSIHLFQYIPLRFIQYLYVYLYASAASLSRYCGHQCRRRANDEHSSWFRSLIRMYLYYYYY